MAQVRIHCMGEVAARQGGALGRVRGGVGWGGCRRSEEGNSDAGSCGERKPSTAPCLPFDRHAATTQGGNRNTAEHSEHLCGLAISEMFAEMPFVVKF